MSANLAVYTFGGLRILKVGELFTRFDSRKVEALFIKLALAERPQPREILQIYFGMITPSSRLVPTCDGCVRDCASNLSPT